MGIQSHSTKMEQKNEFDIEEIVSECATNI